MIIKPQIYGGTVKQRFASLYLGTSFSCSAGEILSGEDSITIPVTWFYRRWVTRGYSTTGLAH